jgi:rod shape-determining protein MreC
MRNLFVFFRRFSVFILFIVAQGVALMILVHYNRSHRAWYMQASYELTGRINNQANKVESYFALKENNRLLAEENARLKNELRQNFITFDTSVNVVADTVKWDTTGKPRKYFYRHAQVVDNSVAGQKNYITIQRGANQGISKDQAVTSAGGIVGIVIDGNANYSIVMSLLNRDTRTSVLMKKDLATGILTWDGRSPDRLQLTISKSSIVTKGDTVLTSNSSDKYPPGLMVVVTICYK